MKPSLWILALIALPASLAAQQVEYALRPGRLEGSGGSTWGLRYGLGIPPARLYSLEPRFPKAWSYTAALDGSLAILSRATTEPLARGRFDAGLRVQLQEVNRCAPDVPNCPPGTKFDYGYILLGVNAGGEVGQHAREVEGAVGLSLLYRAKLGTPTGLWPLVPNASLTLTLVRPLHSEARDSLDVATESHGRVNTALVWNRIMLASGVPDWVSRARLEAELRYFSDFGRADADAAAAAAHGTFVALGAAYELTGALPFVRDVFVTWSEGEHPTQAERRAWLVGATIGSSR